MKGTLVLKDGSKFEGQIFGSPKSASGELVFSTGMMGYPESLTDPSYKGQILVLTYPLVGNYGVPDKDFWESDQIMVSGLVVSDYIDTPSHYQSKKTLSEWFAEEDLPIIQVKDTRLLTQKIRDRGSILGKIQVLENVSFYDPNKESLIDKVSIDTMNTKGSGKKRLLLFDCGAKRNIRKRLLARDTTVITVPWNLDPFLEKNLKFDGIVISNGPGDPKFAEETIKIIRKALGKKVPTLGVCLGHQLLTLAAGGDTKKMKYGHRSQNQPCTMFEKGKETSRCYITTQNHGFCVERIPKDFYPWFVNANDGTNEGIIHKKLPFLSVQFHPEAMPGPTDADWIFDFFLSKI